MTSAPTAPHHDDAHDAHAAHDDAHHPTVRPGRRPARRRVPAVRSAALATAAVLLLGAGLTACEGGAALCLSDDSCDVVVHTDDADSTRTVEVFGGDRKVELTVGRITDTTAEVKLGTETKTLTEDTETVIGPAKVTLRRADAEEHAAQLHVAR
ncbi:hypothetical protein [Kitasatospora sp. NPDC093806]|uniref:hypothetical protein n=1 Tax=Kitasatospora sp. NPDC093806 TaxID=3155075 RepID=UPI00341B3387